MVNVNSYVLMYCYQQFGVEKCMLVVLNEGVYDVWLMVYLEKVCEFMWVYLVNWFIVNLVQKQLVWVGLG